MPIRFQTFRSGVQCVYLIHLDAPHFHARHYLGTTADLPARLATHWAGRGSPLLRAVRLAGGRWQVVRTWRGGRSLERSLKRSHNAPRLCPVCAALAERATNFAGGTKS